MLSQPILPRKFELLLKTKTYKSRSPGLQRTRLNDRGWDRLSGQSLGGRNAGVALEVRQQNPAKCLASLQGALQRP